MDELTLEVSAIGKIITSKLKEELSRIIVPFGEFVTTSNEENRRSNSKFFALIKSSCYCNRFRRQKLLDSKGQEWILAEMEDFETANNIWSLVSKKETPSIY